MPVYTSLRQYKKKTRNRQKWLYGYSVDSNAMCYLEGSGAFLDGELPVDLLKLGVDFNQSDTISLLGDTATYNAYPIITSMSANASMGNTINFSYSIFGKILESFAYGFEDKITEPSEPPIDFGTTRYYCPGDGEPEQFTWNVSTSVVNSGCVSGEAGSKVGAVRVSSLNASLTQFYEGSSGDATINSSALFLPPPCGTLLQAADFTVSETGTEYTTDNTSGRDFVSAECDGIPEIPTYWIEYPVIES